MMKMTRQIPTKMVHRTKMIRMTITTVLLIKRMMTITTMVLLIRKTRSIHHMKVTIKKIIKKTTKKTTKTRTLRMMKKQDGVHFSRKDAVVQMHYRFCFMLDTPIMELEREESLAVQK